MHKSGKKIFAVSALFFISIVFFSCSGKYDLNGKWKFPDGSSIKFDTEKGTYSAKGDTSSSKGEFTLITTGVLETDDGSSFSIAPGTNGFTIDFYGSEIYAKGKKVNRLEDLDGLYSGTGDNGNVEFLFDKKTHVLTITLGEDSIQVYYMINTNEAILFTSGHYASSFPYPIEWKDRKQVIVDGTLLKR